MEAIMDPPPRYGSSVAWLGKGMVEKTGWGKPNPSREGPIAKGAVFKR